VNDLRLPAAPRATHQPEAQIERLSRKIDDQNGRKELTVGLLIRDLPDVASKPGLAPVGKNLLR
jgi:hypothetical protein